MSGHKLREDLERLRAEINLSAHADAETRRKLNELIDAIDARAGESRPDGSDADLVSTVRQAIGHFETEHPRATAILNDILQTLVNMGI